MMTCFRTTVGAALFLLVTELFWRSEPGTDALYVRRAVYNFTVRIVPGAENKFTLFYPDETKIATIFYGAIINRTADPASCRLYVKLYSSDPKTFPVEHGCLSERAVCSVYRVAQSHCTDAVVNNLTDTCQDGKSSHLRDHLPTKFSFGSTLSSFNTITFLLKMLYCYSKKTAVTTTHTSVTLGTTVPPSTTTQKRTTLKHTTSTSTATPTTTAYKSKTTTSEISSPTTSRTTVAATTSQPETKTPSKTTAPETTHKVTTTTVKFTSGSTRLTSWGTSTLNKSSAAPAAISTTTIHLIAGVCAGLFFIFVVIAGIFWRKRKSLKNAFEEKPPIKNPRTTTGDTPLGEYEMVDFQRNLPHKYYEISHPTSAQDGHGKNHHYEIPISRNDGYEVPKDNLYEIPIGGPVKKTHHYEDITGPSPGYENA